jgi:voltage-gated potassium channel Kch
LALVVRVFDSVLAAYLERTLHHCSILSVSALVAPHFARAATQAMKEAAEKLHGAGAVAAGPLPRRRSVARARPDRVLLGVLCGLLGLVAVATPFFAVTLKLSLLDAFYFVWTTITTVGYGDISLREATALAKLVGVVLMFGGAAFVAVIFSFFTDWTITRRLDVLRGRVRVRGHGHVVIVGAGHVGVRVAALMRTAGHRVVVVERDGEGRHVADLRAQGHHVLVADATSEEALALAGVDRASAVLALTEGEATNLHVVLLARAMRPELALVMKTVSPQLSAHVSGRGDAIAISPVATAADQFVQAALGEI